MSRPLRPPPRRRHIGQTHPVVRHGGNAPQFMVIRCTVAVVWHGFPAVWLLAAADAISPLAEYALYVVCDLMAKYLILFVSIASIE